MSRKKKPQKNTLRKKNQQLAKRPPTQPVDYQLGGDQANHRMVTTSQTVVTQHHSGPLPAPAVLREYDDIVPGAAKTIIALFEKQSNHRIEMEKHVTREDVKRSYWGLAAGFVLSFVCITGSIWLVSQDHDAAGTIIAGGSVATLAGVFVYGTNSRKKERESRVKQLAGGNKPEDGNSVTAGAS